MPDPTLSEVHADLVGRLKHDERLRHVETSQAAQAATMSAVQGELRGMRAEAKADKAELLTAIADSKPKPVWPAVSSVIACIALLLVVAERLYS